MALILLCEHDEAVWGPLSAQLEMLGHTCHVAKDGIIGVAFVRATEYDLIISNIRLPGMDGFEFLSTVLPRIQAVTPYIIMTGYRDAQYVVRAVEIGAYDFIRKPWDMIEMRHSVKRALQRRADIEFRRECQADLERRVQAAVAEVKSAYDDTVIGLAGLVAGRDAATADHCARVCDLCFRLGREMAIDAAYLRDLVLGAMLHDIGKRKISDAILNKPGKLTEDEWTIMRLHPGYGAEIVERIAYLKDASEVVRATMSAGMAPAIRRG